MALGCDPSCAGFIFGSGAVLGDRGAGWHCRLSKAVTRAASTTMFRFRRATRTSKTTNPKTSTAQAVIKACKEYGTARRLKCVPSIILGDALWRKYRANQTMQQKSFVRSSGSCGYCVAGLFQLETDLSKTAECQQVHFLFCLKTIGMLRDMRRLIAALTVTVWRRLQALQVDLRLFAPLAVALREFRNGF